MICQKTGCCFCANGASCGGISRIEEAQTFWLDAHAVFPAILQVGFTDHQRIWHTGIQITTETAFPKTRCWIGSQIERGIRQS